VMMLLLVKLLLLLLLFYARVASANRAYASGGNVVTADFGVAIVIGASIIVIVVPYDTTVFVGKTLGASIRSFLCIQVHTRTHTHKRAYKRTRSRARTYIKDRIYTHVTNHTKLSHYLALTKTQTLSFSFSLSLSLSLSLTD
jgi:hypothetical protein